MTWRIHQLINDETGEIRPFSPDLSPDIREFRALIRAIKHRQALQQLRHMRPVPRQIKADLPSPDEQVAVAMADFFKMALDGEGGGGGE